MLNKFYELIEKKKQFYDKNQTLYWFISLAFIVFWVFAFKSSVLDANNIPSGSMQPTLKIGDFLFVNKMRYTFRLPFTDKTLFRMDKPKRGDIVTFTVPHIYGPSKTLVKRVVGLPGDKIEVDNGSITINGKPQKLVVANNDARKVLADLDSPSLFNELFHETVVDEKSGRVLTHFMQRTTQVIATYPNTSQRANCLIKMKVDKYSECPNQSDYSAVIPDDKYIVMGDNRHNSEDSRYWGYVDLENIQGKVFLSYFSVNWNTQHFRSSLSGESNNPLLLFIEWASFQRKGIYVRWNRIGKRIY